MSKKYHLILLIIMGSANNISEKEIAYIYINYPKEKCCKRRIRMIKKIGDAQRYISTPIAIANITTECHKLYSNCYTLEQCSMQI